VRCKKKKESEEENQLLEMIVCLRYSTEVNSILKNKKKEKTVGSVSSYATYRCASFFLKIKMPLISNHQLRAARK
jgi:hypothetical protein